MAYGSGSSYGYSYVNALIDELEDYKDEFRDIVQNSFDNPSEVDPFDISAVLIKSDLKDEIVESGSVHYDDILEHICSASNWFDLMELLANADMKIDMDTSLLTLETMLRAEAIYNAMDNFVLDNIDYLTSSDVRSSARRGFPRRVSASRRVHRRRLPRR